MKRIKNNLGALLAIPMLFIFVSCSRDSSKGTKYTLATAFDSIVFNTFEVNEEEFFLSCFALEEVLQRKLPELEIDNARYLAKELRVMVATGRGGKFGIPRRNGGVSLREICEIFAKTWDVTILIDGNTVMVIDHFDVERFSHSIVIEMKK